MQDFAEAVKRLDKLFKADYGMYCLALHAHIEEWLHSKGFSTLDEGFYSGMYGWNSSRQHDNLVHQICSQHSVTNGVRHDFEQLTGEEAVAMTGCVVRFWRLNSIMEEQLQIFTGIIKSQWEQYQAAADPELEQQSRKLQELQQQNEQLTGQLAEFRQLQQEKEELQAQLEQADIEIKKLEGSTKETETLKQRIDKLRRERAKLKEESLKLSQQNQKYEKLEELISYTRRFALLSRSRIEYEKSLQQLTPEQQKIVENADPDGTMLVRGGAGTGKTTVLLAQLNKVVAGGASAKFLTFTNVLTGFNRYVSNVMGIGLEEDGVVTVFSFLLSVLRSFLPGVRIEFDHKKLSGVVSDCGIGTEPLSHKQLLQEAESTVWGRIAEKEAYLEGRVKRGGKERLSRERKALVWEQTLRLHKELEKRSIYSSNAAWYKLHQLIEADPDFEAPVDYLFIDEAQDLSTVALACLKKLARRGVVLAADNGQSIYGAPPDYQKIGMELRGKRTHVLRTSFRSTCQLHRVSEKFRQLSGELADNEETVPFRQGMPPQYYEADSATKLYQPLAETVRMVVEQLGYAPGNVAVIAPHSFFGKIAQQLTRIGLASEQMKSSGFDFENHTDKVLLVTPQSAKGVDFPVVLQFVPKLQQLGYSLSESQVRNLLYVGMTRAMDALYIFARRDEQSPVFQDLRRALQVSK